jgi:hydrogenase expression/formation protein HypE
MRGEVKGACEILGLDPLCMANEGKLIAVGAAEIADAVVAGLRECPNGRYVCVIGEVKGRSEGRAARNGRSGDRLWRSPNS